MKIKHLFSVLLVLALSTFASCDWFDNLDDVTFDVEVPVDLVVDIDTPSYTGEVLLNAAADPDVAEYANKIKDFKINRITYLVTTAQPSTLNFDGSLRIKSNNEILSSVTDLTFTNTSEVDLPADLDGFNDLAAKLKEDNQETIQFGGQFSSTPNVFTIKLRFYLSVTAEAL
jgi:hypothetical protein